MAASGEEQKWKKSGERALVNAMCEQISVNHEIRSLESCRARLGSSTDNLCHKRDEEGGGVG